MATYSKKPELGAEEPSDQREQKEEGIQKIEIVSWCDRHLKIKEMPLQPQAPKSCLCPSVLCLPCTVPALVGSAFVVMMVTALLSIQVEQVTCVSYAVMYTCKGNKLYTEWVFGILQCFYSFQFCPEWLFGILQCFYSFQFCPVRSGCVTPSKVPLFSRC